MIFKNEASKMKWQKQVNMQTSPYGKNTVAFIEKWAELMEAKIAKDYVVSEIANSTSMEVDDSITDYVIAISIQWLAEVWIYGEELLGWKNSPQFWE